MFDTVCYELAAAFLEGDYDTEVNRVRLAQYIQISIESELQEIEREAEAAHSATLPNGGTCPKCGLPHGGSCPYPQTQAVSR